ncbi:SFH4, partial [Symbiodinium necroappetens]
TAFEAFLRGSDALSDQQWEELAPAKAWRSAATRGGERFVKMAVYHSSFFCLRVTPFYLVEVLVSLRRLPPTALPDHLFQSSCWVKMNLVMYVHYSVRGDPDGDDGDDVGDENDAELDSDPKLLRMIRVSRLGDTVANLQTRRDREVGELTLKRDELEEARRRFESEDQMHSACLALML